MTSKAVKRLFDLEIDEVSLVDRAANQHARVAIAKNDTSGEEPTMPRIYDEAGDEVFEDELEIGGTYFDDAGNEYVFVEVDEDDDDPNAEYDDNSEYEDERELAGVGKAFNPSSWGGRAKAGAANVKSAAKDYEKWNPKGARAGKILRNPGVRYGSAGVAGAGVGYGVNKSLGQSVLEELSKALDQGERDEVIGKAMDYVAQADRRAYRAEALAKSLADEREYEEFVELAKSYELPVDPYELGAVLKSAAATMSEDELGVLDRILKSASETGALYEELGSAGGYQTSDIMDEVEALANQSVGKFDTLSREQLITEMFSVNPSAYDEYIAERR